MRIVLDTSILTRAISGPLGPAAETLNRIRPPHLLILSAGTLSELGRVLCYDRIRRLHGLDDAGIDEYLAKLETTSLIVTAAPMSRVVPDDPDDDNVIAAAVAGGAEVICTRDRHFYHPSVLQYCAERSIRIMDDIELLRLLREMESSGAP